MHYIVWIGSQISNHKDLLDDEDLFYEKDSYKSGDSCRLTQETKAEINRMGDNTNNLSYCIRPYIPMDIQPAEVRSSVLGLDMALKYIQVTIGQNIFQQVLTFIRYMYSIGIPVLWFSFKCYQEAIELYNDSLDDSEHSSTVEADSSVGTPTTPICK